MLKIFVAWGVALSACAPSAASDDGVLGTKPSTDGGTSSSTGGKTPLPLVRGTSLTLASRGGDGRRVPIEAASTGRPSVVEVVAIDGGSVTLLARAVGATELTYRLSPDGGSLLSQPLSVLEPVGFQLTTCLDAVERSILRIPFQFETDDAGWLQGAGRYPVELVGETDATVQLDQSSSRELQVTAGVKDINLRSTLVPPGRTVHTEHIRMHPSAEVTSIAVTGFNRKDAQDAQGSAGTANLYSFAKQHLFVSPTGPGWLTCRTRVQAKIEVAGACVMIDGVTGEVKTSISSATGEFDLSFSGVGCSATFSIDDPHFPEVPPLKLLLYLFVPASGGGGLDGDD